MRLASRRGIAVVIALIALAAVLLASSNSAHGELSLEASAPDSSSARLEWRPPADFEPSRYAISRREIFADGEAGDWRLIDSVATADLPDSPTYLDRLLWRGTTYEYEVQAFASDDDSEPGPVGTQGLTTPTPPSDYRSPRLYADESFWNQTIAERYTSAAPPVQEQDERFASSQEIVEASFVDPPSVMCDDLDVRDYDPAPPNCASSPNFTATHEWGVSLVYSDPASTLYDPIGCTEYGCDVPVGFRLPAYANLERVEDGEVQWGAGTNGDDGKLSVINHASGEELGMWQAELAPHDADVAGDETWSASSRYVSQALGPDATGLVCDPGAFECGGPTVSGFPNMGGIVRPEEILEGEIRHALAIGTPNARGVIACPATQTGGEPYSEDVRAVPIGAHVQLDPEYEIPSTWPPAMQTIAEALQVYGAYVDDRSGSVSIQGETDIGRGYPVWEDPESGPDAKIDQLMSASSEEEGGGDLIGLDQLTPAFPLDKLRVLEIEENTGPGACTQG